MLKRITEAIDEVSYKLFGRITEKKLRKLNQRKAMMKRDYPERHQRALLIFSKDRIVQNDERDW